MHPRAVEQRAWRKKNAEASKNWDLRKNFGISYDKYKQLVEEQGGVCAICKQKETFLHHMTKTVANLAVDHCHKTGKIRGLLCHKCNHGLGKFGDDPALLRLAAAYLEANQ